MFARVADYRFPLDKLDQGVEAFNRGMESIGRLPGIREGYCLVDRAGGKAVTITLWESEQALIASVEAGKRVRNEGTTSAAGTVESVAEYEVVVHKQF